MPTLTGAHPYLSFKILIKKNIGRFDVPVNDFRMTILVQIGKTPSASKTNLKSCTPLHDRHVRVWTQDIS